MSQQPFTLWVTPDTLYIPMPEWADDDMSINVNNKLFNMWTGEIEVNHIELNDEPLILNGIMTPEFYTSYPSDTINSTVEAIWTIQNTHAEATISDLSTCLNGVYVIQDFSFGTIKKTLAFSYSLKLQKVRDI